jgi:hypothetical protein
VIRLPSLTHRRSPKIGHAAENFVKSEAVADKIRRAGNALLKLKIWSNLRLSGRLDSRARNCQGRAEAVAVKNRGTIRFINENLAGANTSHHVSCRGLPPQSFRRTLDTRRLASCCKRSSWGKRAERIIPSKWGALTRNRDQTELLSDRNPRLPM